jgi:DNA (cytosine-5)-methyltransferase 1
MIQKGYFIKLTVYPSFCSGGMSQGFKKNNFNVIGAVDWNQNAIATFSLNNPGVPIFNEDIRLWFEKVKQGKPGYVFFGVDHIQASPPCQSFSLANIFGGQNDELNKSMTLLLIEIICFIKPKTFSMENVTGLLHPSNVDVLREVAAKLIEFGYDVRIYVLNSSKYGDPQLRHRVFLFAAKRGMPLPNRPIETHGDKFVAKPKYSQEIQVPKPKKEVSSKDALQDLEEIEPESGAGIVHVNGDLVYNHSLATTKLYSERTKLKPNRGAHTVRSTNKFEHYKHNRCLTHRELARLQGFPDSYKFIGSAKEISLQIGNAVPCNTACAVAKAIRDRCYPMMF